MTDFKELFASLPVVLTPSEMAAADTVTISEAGINGFTLMETAGRALAECAKSIVAIPEGLQLPGSHISVFCGTGNNGGDGFVAARVLQQSGYPVHVFVVGDVNKMSDDTRAHFASMEFAFANGLPESDCLSIDGDLPEWSDLPGFPGSELIVDALIGTGLHSDVRGTAANVIDAINEHSAQVVSADIPSGLSGLTGKVLGNAVRADWTVTMGALKRGLLIGTGPYHSGTIIVAQIGISEHSIQSVQSDSEHVRLMTPEFAEYCRPERTFESSKYTSGPAAVVGGSSNYTGAPVLAATAAARIGSGYVQCFCPPEIETILKEKLTEITVTPWTMPLSESGLSRARAVLVGPGLGREQDVQRYIMELLTFVSESEHNKAVIDADGLAAITDHKDQISKWSDGNWILTPHAGELRFLGESYESGESVIDSALRVARKWNCVVLLKGFPSITAAPDGRVIINDSTLAAAATAGTGDVLAGIVAGLVAQNVLPFEAAASGIQIAASLAEVYCRENRGSSMMASDLLIALAKNDFDTI